MESFLTDNRTSDIEGYEEGFWSDLQGHFLDHIDEVNLKLAKAGLPTLGQKPA